MGAHLPKAMLHFTQFLHLLPAPELKGCKQKVQKSGSHVSLSCSRQGGVFGACPVRQMKTGSPARTASLVCGARETHRNFCNICLHPLGVVFLTNCPCRYRLSSDDYRIPLDAHDDVHDALREGWTGSPGIGHTLTQRRTQSRQAVRRGQPVLLRAGISKMRRITH